MLRLERAGAIPFGYEILGVDINAGIDDSTRAQIRRAFDSEGVVFMRGQALDTLHHVEFSRRFGDLEIHFLKQFLHPAHPEILVVSNIVENGRPVGQADAGRYWHSDLTYAVTPSRGSVMCAVEIPVSDTGVALGDTCFASAALAYEALDSAMKRRLDGMQAVHRFDARYRRNAAIVELDGEQAAAQADVVHPVVLRHPVTGRPGIYVNELFTVRVVGLAEKDSRDLIDELCAHVTRREFVYRHHWQPGDVLMWDNYTVQHLAIGDYGAARRRMHKTTLKGAQWPLS